MPVSQPSPVTSRPLRALDGAQPVAARELETVARLGLEEGHEQRELRHLAAAEFEDPVHRPAPEHLAGARQAQLEASVAERLQDEAGNRGLLALDLQQHVALVDGRGGGGLPAADGHGDHDEGRDDPLAREQRADQLAELDFLVARRAGVGRGGRGVGHIWRSLSR
jgi:hypothetical protein